MRTKLDEGQMGFSCGLVGLPNVGKSTIFNALVKGTAAAANFPFCTIEPNTGVVSVPDDRLLTLSRLEETGKAIPTTLKFFDIAGLVEGANKGEGLGNQFLGHIRNIDAVAHIVRLFEDEDVAHVSGSVDPVRDLELIRTELMLADLDMLRNKLEKSSKLIRGGDDEQKKELDAAAKFADQLERGETPDVASEDKELPDQLGLLSLKPAFICANVDEEGFSNFESHEKASELHALASEWDMEVIPVCGKLEEELSQLDPDEARLFLEDLGVEESGLARVVRVGYRLLDLITFFTFNENEARAWTVESGSTAPEAAGKIHTDMERGFIRMEVVSFSDLETCGGWNHARTEGKMRIEGKDYILQDGDCCFVRFSK